MKATIAREYPTTPPIKSVTIELTLDEAIELQRTITSANSAKVKDRLFDTLTWLFRKEDIAGGIYV